MNRIYYKGQILQNIKSFRLRWYGLIENMNDERMPKQK
jgi:hypothetical protein